MCNKDSLREAVLKGRVHLTWDGRLILTFKVNDGMNAMCTFDLNPIRKHEAFIIIGGKPDDFITQEATFPDEKDSLVGLLDL